MSLARTAAPTTTTSSGRGRRTEAEARRRRQGLALVTPTALLVAVFFAIPVGLVFFMSGSDWPLLRGYQGLDFPTNYQAAATHASFWPAVAFTLKYTIITTVLLIGIALGLALVVQESSRWRSLLRTTILLPTSLGLASTSLLFYGLYAPQDGSLTDGLARLGITDGPVAVLGIPEGALWATVALIVWRFSGLYMLLLLVGLQSISNELYEAARIDGAGRWLIFRRITLPLLRPSLALSTIMCVTGSLLAFDQFFILTKGGPDGSTLTLVQLVYNFAFEARRDLGLAAALSVVLLVALVVLNAVQLRVLRGKEVA